MLIWNKSSYIAKELFAVNVHLKLLVCGTAESRFFEKYMVYKTNEKKHTQDSMHIYIYIVFLFITSPVDSIL